MLRKRGGRPLNQGRSKDMCNMINYCQLIDLGFKGSKYTWLNKCFKQINALIFERLDSFLANDEWVQQYPYAQVNHLPQTHSDYYPLLLTLQPRRPLKQEQIFCFKIMWMSHPDLINTVLDSWSNSPHIIQNIKEFRNQVRLWNKSTFGNLIYKKKKNSKGLGKNPKIPKFRK